MMQTVCSRSQVEADAIAHLKIGRYVRFEPSAIEQYLDAQRRAAGR